MAMEPLPLGFGDAMDTTLFSTLCSFHKELQPQEMICRQKPQAAVTIIDGADLGSCHPATLMQSSSCTKS